MSIKMPFIVKVLVKSYVLILYIRTLCLKKQIIKSPADSLAHYMPEVKVPDSFASSPTIHFVIPFRDQVHLTKICVEGLLRMKQPSWTITLVDNGSIEAETKAWKSKIGAVAGIRILDIPGPFNFSKMMNQASQRAADYTVFVNNDLEFEGDKLTAFLAAGISLGSLSNFGVLGSSLLFPNRSIQHLFVATGVKLVAAHPLRTFPCELTSTWFAAKVRKVPAVTGALFMVRTSVFNELDGFAEDLPTAYQDVDFCLKVRRAGYEVYTYTPVVAVHHESVTRKKDNPVDQMKIMYERWGQALAQDEAYPLELTRWTERPLLSWKEGRYPFVNL